MNPGEIWRLDDGSLRLVLSNSTYNSSALNRVITAVVGPPPTSGFDPFAVATPSGTVYADRVAMHPRHWLVQGVVRVGDEAFAEVRTHLQFLLCDA